MQVIDGKTYYTFAEAAQETGYTIGTIRTYVSKNEVEGEKLADGFVLTELGMKQLRIRKNRDENIVKPMEQKEPRKPKPKFQRMVERSLHFRGEHLKLYSKIHTIASAKNITVHDYCMAVLEQSTEDRQAILDQIEKLKEQL